MRGGHSSWHHLLCFCPDVVGVVGTHIPRGTISLLQLSLPIQLDTWCCIQSVILHNLPLGRHLYIIYIEFSTPVQGEAWLLSVTHSTMQGGQSENHFPDGARDQV